MVTATPTSSAVLAAIAAVHDGFNASSGPRLNNDSYGNGSSVTAADISSSSSSSSSNTNNNNVDSMLELQFDRWEINSTVESVLVPILFAIIFVVGLVGNGTLILSVIANKVMCNIPNILIVSLSLGDFLLILISVPVTSIYYTFVNWPFGSAVCKINEFIQTVSLGVSVFTLTALSADRYVAIVNPMAKLTGRTLRTTIATVVGIWVLSLLLAIPDAVFSKEQTFNVTNHSIVKICSQFDHSEMSSYPKTYITIRLFVYFILPLLTIGLFYSMMARILIRSSDSVPVDSKTGAATHHRQIAARKKVARVVLSFVIIFMICWLPRHIFLMWLFYDVGSQFNDFWHVFKIGGFCLTFINSCVNPFALYFLSGQFRKYYNRYLFCCCRRVRYTSLEPTSTMHNLHSTTRRVSATNTSIVHSQSMC
ncbi:unnamed protein product [Lymnaea stagnalis]|uniref:G-protein coupled receptors family 1 profile domain-containing protein n=1 Tax=Lymnaea stagnalis TaxID=6523 RepID=A0AAV2I6F4_LYMST